MADDPQPAGEWNFEEELDNLEKVVDLLERGELSLEEAIRKYESGFRSLKRCYEILERAKKRIEVLTGGLPSQVRTQDPLPTEDPRGWVDRSAGEYRDATSDGDGPETDRGRKAED